MSIGKNYDEALRQISFYGGLSDDRKLGTKNSYADAECMDVRQQPSQMTVLPMGHNMSGNFTGLPVAMTQLPNGNLFALDDKSNVYKNNNSTWENFNTTTGENFMLGDIKWTTEDDTLYWTTRDSIKWQRNSLSVPNGSIYTYSDILDSSERAEQIIEEVYSMYYQGNGVYRVLGYSGTTSIGTYTLGTSISETDSNRNYFIPSATPIHYISVSVNSISESSTLKCYLHDENDNELGVATASASTTGVVSFVFPNPIKTGTASTNYNYRYHFHIISTNGTVKLNTANNPGTASGIIMALYIKALCNSNYHPSVLTPSGIMIGNRSYIALFTPSGITNPLDPEFPIMSVYNPCKLYVGDDYTIVGLCENDEFIVAAGAMISDNGVDMQHGALFFWDTNTQSTNFMIDSPMGIPENIYSYNNIIYMTINGALYAYTGTKELINVRTIDNNSNSEYTGNNGSTSVYPNCAAVRHGIMILGYPSQTSLTSLRFGIYGWGSNNKNYPNCLTYNYKLNESLSTQNNTSTQTLRLGCVYNFGNILYYGYEENGISKISVVDNLSYPASKFKYETLAFDGSCPGKEKLALRIAITFRNLPIDSSITPKYKIDDGEWINGNTYTRTSKNSQEGTIVMDINKRFLDIQFGFDGTNSGVLSTPKILSVDLDFRTLNEERRIS